MLTQENYFGVFWFFFNGLKRMKGSTWQTITARIVPGLNHSSNFFDCLNQMNQFFGCRCYVRLDFVRQFKSKKSCSTTFKSCDVRLGFSSTWKQQLSNIKLVELNQENNYVQLMLILTKAFFLSFFLLKLKLSLTS